MILKAACTDASESPMHTALRVLPMSMQAGWALVVLHQAGVVSACR
jgi:hypothetical protein